MFVTVTVSIYMWHGSSYIPYNQSADTPTAVEAAASLADAVKLMQTYVLTSMGQDLSAMGFSGASGCRYALPSSGSVAVVMNCSRERRTRRLWHLLSLAAARRTWHHKGITARRRATKRMKPQLMLPS